MVEALSRLRKEAGSGASLTVWKGGVGARSLVVAQVHGATHRLGRYVRSVREASASRAPRANGELVRWACAR
jgi:hypothetical protein